MVTFSYLVTYKKYTIIYKKYFIQKYKNKKIYKCVLCVVCKIIIYIYNICVEKNR